MAKNTPEEIIRPTLDSQQAASLFKGQISKIEALKKLRRSDPEVGKWENFTQQLIIKAFGQPHGNLENFNQVRRSSLFMAGHASEEELHENYLKQREKLEKLLEGFVEQLELFAPPPDQSPGAPKIKTLSKKIFIVHGHDSQAKTELALFLTRLGFDPIILHEQANSGQTLIEKLEKNSDVGFAFTILTPDDLGKAKDADALRERARQNVVFEFGLFAGKLGRKHVCCLYTGNVELPADLHGLAYVPYKNSINEVQLDLIKELRAVGYEVKV